MPGFTARSPDRSAGVVSLPETMPLIALIAALFFLIPLAGCDTSEARLEILAGAAQKNGRTQTAASLKAESDAGNISYSDALTRAEELVQSGDPNALAFAGAVLDLAEMLGDELPRGGEFEIFWRRVGRLAYTSAHAAFEAGDYETGSMLVLAGPDRWKNDPYWIAYPNHEILVALSMAYRGDARGGIALLDRRTPQPDEYAQAIRDLAEIQRRQAESQLGGD